MLCGKITSTAGQVMFKDPKLKVFTLIALTHASFFRNGRLVHLTNLLNQFNAIQSSVSNLSISATANSLWLVI